MKKLLFTISFLLVAYVGSTQEYQISFNGYCYSGVWTFNDPHNSNQHQELLFIMVDYDDGSTVEIGTGFPNAIDGPEGDYFAGSTVFDKSEKQPVRIRFEHSSAYGVGGTNQVIRSDGTVAYSIYPGASSGLTLCMGEQYIDLTDASGPYPRLSSGYGHVTVKPLMDLERTGTDIAGYQDPLEINATAGFPESYYNNLEYQIGTGGSWQNVPVNYNNSSNPHLISFIPKDFLPISAVNSSVNFRIKHCEEVFTNVLNYDLRFSAPHITNITKKNVTCFDSQDGEVAITFDRPLETNEYLNIAIVDLEKPEGGGVYEVVKNANNITSLDGSNRIIIQGLPAGEGQYAIQLVAGLNGVIYYSDGTNHSGTFEVERPDRVHFSVTDVVNVYCNDGDGNPDNNNDGEIHLSASGGGPGIYQYSINEEGNSDENWQDFSGTSTHVIDNLKPAAYDIRVRKVVGDENYCLAKHPGAVEGTLGDVMVVSRSINPPLTPLRVEYVNTVEPTAFGNNDGSIKAMVYGGTMFDDNTYQFEWRDSEGNLLIAAETEYEFGQGYFITLRDLPADTYYLTAWDKNYSEATYKQGCAITNSEMKLDQPELLSFTFEEKESISCFNDDNGELVVHAQGGVTLDVTDNGGLPYYYSWSKKNETGTWELLTSETDSILDNATAGEYRVIIEDANNITIGQAYTLNQPGLLEISHTQTDVFCFGGNDGAIDITILGGTAPYNIEWNSDNWEEGKDIEDLSELTAGTYYVKVTDANGCTANKTIPIEEPEELIVTYPSEFFQPTGFGLTDGWIEATVTGGTSNADGTYVFEWRDEDGQLVNNQVVTSVDDVNGIYTLRLENAGAGSYVLSVSDANYTAATVAGGCRKENLSYSLDEPGQIQIYIAEHTPISCNSSNEYNNPAGDGKLVAHATGGVKFSPGLPYKYTWKKKNETTGVWEILTSQTDSIASNLNAGEYAVNIEDKNGIILGEYENNVLTQALDSTYELLEPELLEVTFNKQMVNCHNGNDGWAEVIITGGTPPYNFLWDNGETTARRYSLEAGEYEVIVTDSRGCEVIGSVEIEEPTNEFTADYTSYGIPSSIGASDAWIEVLISGGTPFDNGRYVYEWTNASGDILNTQTTSEVVNISGSSFYRVRLNDVPSGSYFLTVTDKNYEIAESKFGCTIIESEFNISEPIEASIDVYNPISCNSQNAFLDPSSEGVLVAHVEGGVPFSVGQPYNYIWKKLDENGQWVVIEGQDTEIATGLDAGTYALNVEDSQGNIIGTYESGTLIEAHDVVFEFEEPELLQIELNSTAVSCEAGNDGTISVSISGGVPGYEIQWSTGETTAKITNVTGGIYVVYVTDSRGCQAMGQIEVSQPGGMMIQTIEQRNPTCFGGNDGALQVEVSGGTAPYTYLWNTGSTNPFISNLSQGKYELRVIDGEGCIAYVEYILQDPEPVTVDLGEDRTICLDQGVFYDITIDDPDATYQWESDNGFSSTSPIVELSEGGTYRAMAISSNGCVGSDALTINVSDNAIDAYFLLTTQAFAGEEVILVNVSSPVGEKVEWTVPDGAKKVYEDKEKLVVHFNDAGSYDINLRSVQGSCYQDYTKRIIVEKATDLSGTGEYNSGFINEFIVYPNPTDGEFKVKISLEEEAKISLKIISLSTSQVINNRIEESTSEYLLDYNIDMVPGLYILLLETPKGDEVRKIIFN